MRFSALWHSRKGNCFLRAVSLVLTACLLLTGTGLSAVAAETNYVDLEADTVCFQPGVTLIQERDFTITTQDIYAQRNGFIILEMTARNTGKEPLYFRKVRAVIGGYDVGTTMYQQIRPGNQATIKLSIDVLPLAAIGMEVLPELDMTFDVVHGETYEQRYDNCMMTIPLGVPVDMEYYPDGSCIYADQSLELTLLGAVQVEGRASPSLIFLLRNNLDGTVTVRNEGALAVNRHEYSLYLTQNAAAYADTVFSVASPDIYPSELSGKTFTMEFPLQICTGMLNPLIDMEVHVRIDRDGKIQSCKAEAEENPSYAKYISEFTQSPNMFVGMFRNYAPSSDYIQTLRDKYPENMPRYADGLMMTPVSEWLTLYLAELKDRGFGFGVAERPDLCSETSYVVELTEDGKGVIQVAFSLLDGISRYAQVITLGCSAKDYRDRSDYAEVMWCAYDLLNVHMTAEKHSGLLENSEVSQSDAYGVMLRGEYDGLGYLFASGETVFLAISPDLSLPVFAGLGSGGQVSAHSDEISQVLPMDDGSVAVLYADGTVAVSGNGELSKAVSGWSNVKKLYYDRFAVLADYDPMLAGLTEDGRVLTTEGMLSGWRNVKELLLYHTEMVGITEDGQVLAYGDLEDDSFLTDLTDVEMLVYSEVQGLWCCLKKNGNVHILEQGMDSGKVYWRNGKEIRDSGHGFYVIKTNGTVDGNLEDSYAGLKGAVKVVDFNDWVFGISADGRLLTHNKGNIYINGGDIMVDKPGSSEYMGEVDVDEFDQIRDIEVFYGLILLNKDGTVDSIGGYPEWDLRTWKNIRSVCGTSDPVWGEMIALYGIHNDGSVIVSRYNGDLQTQTVTDQYRGWKLQALYSGYMGVVGLTTDGKLVGDGIYEEVDFSVFDR